MDLKILFPPTWSVDRDSATPAYGQIEERIGELIAGGQLLPGDRLPPERDLAEWVGVSRMTARDALRSLADRGLLQRDVGRGTFVARAKLAHDLTSFSGFSEMVRRQGMAVTSRIRSINDVVVPDAIADELKLEPGGRAYRIERIRYADDEPMTLEDSWFPTERFPDLLAHDLRGSLYELIRDVYDRTPVRAVERLEPVVAESDQADALGVAVGAPLMLVERVALDGDDIPIEFARDLHRGDRARFVVEVSTPVAQATARA